jgi:heptosyltransferase-2
MLKTNSIQEDREEINLAVRLPNWIGDALMTFPMLKALEKAGIDFTCIGHPWAQDLFSGEKFKIIVSSDVKKVKWAHRTYRAHKFNYGIACPNTFSATLPMRLSGLKTIGYHWLSGLRPKYGNTLHTVENYFELGCPFLDEISDASNIEDRITVHPDSAAESIRIINKIGTPYIVVCPYASNLHKGENKEWPYWESFCHKFDKYKIVALVSPADEQRCKNEFPKIMVMSSNLSVTGAIMKNAEYVIANDSGAMHLASFYGARIIGLFGVTEIHKTKPWYGSYLIGQNQEFLSQEELIEALKD